MASYDFNKPAVGSNYPGFPGEIRAGMDSLAKMLDGTSDTNVPTGAKRKNSGQKYRLEEWDGASWNMVEPGFGNASQQQADWLAGLGSAPAETGSSNTFSGKQEIAFDGPGDYLVIERTNLTGTRLVVDWDGGNLNFLTQVAQDFRFGHGHESDFLLRAEGTPAVSVGGSTSATVLSNFGAGSTGYHIGFEIPSNDAGDGFYIATDSNQDGTVDTLALKINAAGHVGINRSNPSFPLDVLGSAQIESNATNALHVTRADSEVKFILERTGSGASKGSLSCSGLDFVVDAEAGDLELQTGGIAALYVSSVDQGVYTAGVTGGSQGAGTFNATLYDNGNRVYSASNAPAFSDVSGNIADGQVPQSAVTQHEGALSVGFSQITGNIADGQVPESAVTQHAGAIDSADLGDHESQVVELGGDFDAGEEVRCERIGNWVTITATSGSVPHSGGSSPQSSISAIPSQYQPTNELYFFHIDADSLQITDGQISLNNATSGFVDTFSITFLIT